MRSLPRAILSSLVATGIAGTLAAQDMPRNDEQLTAIIRAADTKFWKAYNYCTVDAMRDLVTSNVEFYHDKGGPIAGRADMLEKIRTGLCGGGSQLRREVVHGTEKIYPLRNGDQIYGAVLSGEHVFYVTLPGKPEFLDGRANYTHLWLVEDGTFRMARILSFNHHPAIDLKEVALAPEQLEALTGAYLGPKSGKMTITRDGSLLALQTDKMRFRLHAASASLFFITERDVTFEFASVQGQPVKMTVRERGNVVEEVTRSSAP